MSRSGCSAIHGVSPNKKNKQTNKCLVRNDFLHIDVERKIKVMLLFKDKM